MPDFSLCLSVDTACLFRSTHHRAKSDGTATFFIKRTTLNTCNLELPLCPKCGDTKHVTDQSTRECIYEYKYLCTKCKIWWARSGTGNYTLGEWKEGESWVKRRFFGYACWWIYYSLCKGIRYLVLAYIWCVRLFVQDWFTSYIVESSK